MAIFVNENTKVIVQGLTGGQGKYHGLRNRDYGTQIVGGVTPGKGGQDVDGIPIFEEAELEAVIDRLDVDEAVFAYSDVAHDHVMHLAARAVAAGAGFPLQERNPRNH